MTAARMTGRRDCACPRARHQHGTLRAYACDRCRCFHCRVAHANATKAYRDGHGWREAATVPAVGVRRRLQALTAIGHTGRVIGADLHVTADMVAYLRSSKNPGVTADLHARVAATYDRLWNKPPADDANARRARAMARRFGWLVPLAWDDDTIDDPAGRPAPTGPRQRAVDPIAVERALGGDHHTLTLTRAEAQAVAAHLTARGHGAEAIGLRLHVSGRTVQRWRAVA